MNRVTKEKEFLNAPMGWEVVEDVNEGISDPLSDGLMKGSLAQHLPFVTRRVEDYIERVHNQYNIVISESYVSMDADAAFHIVLLVSRNDYVSIEMLAAKVLAKQLLTTDSEVSMRFKFTIAEEYLKFHYTDHSYKLRYVYKMPYPLLPGYLGGSSYHY